MKNKSTKVARHTFMTDVDEFRRHAGNYSQTGALTASYDADRGTEVKRHRYIGVGVHSQTVTAGGIA